MTMFDYFMLLVVVAGFAFMIRHIYSMDFDKMRRESAEDILYRWGVTYKEVSEELARQWLEDPNKYNKVQLELLRRRVYL